MVDTGLLQLPSSGNSLQGKPGGELHCSSHSVVQGPAAGNKDVVICNKGPRVPC